MNSNKQEETDGTTRRNRTRESFRRIHWMPVTVIILGLLSFSLLIWAYKINARQSWNSAIANAVMDVQIKVADFHLWFEEAITGEPTTDMKKTWEYFDQAVILVEVLLNGGETEHGFIAAPVTDPDLRTRLEDLRLLMAKLKEMSLRRLQDPRVGRIGSDLDRHFNALYKEFQDKALSLEAIIEIERANHEVKSQRLFLGFLLVWAFIVATAAMGLWNREKKRRTAEYALRQANIQLQSQTDELTTFREHLMELVEKRTMELIAKDTDLRQETTERMQAEQSLRESEKKCRILVDYLPQKIFLKDENSVFIFCNDNFARDFKIRTDDICLKTDYDLYPREIAEKYIAEDRKIVASGKPLDIEERQVKDGQDVIIHVFKMPTRNESGAINGILGILWDATERVRLESMAEAVTTMNNIGSIFAGVRHEIGNPINSAKMTLSVLKKRIDTFSKDATGEYIERVLGELSKVDYLLMTLKSFNMYETPEPQRIEIKPFMDKFLSLLTDDFGKKGIAIATVISPEAQWGYADPRALQQVLLNIMSNASDAMDGKDDPRIGITVSRLDGHINIKVTDNGCGISEEQRKKIFMPFFTTKASGTGLGLVIAKKLVSKMNGTLEIKSRRGEGTTVDVSIQALGIDDC